MNESKAIAVLVDRLNKHGEDRSFVKNEKAVAQSLIIPFFRDVLGWNTEDPDECRCEVFIAGKRADYVTYIDGISQFIIEAKAISISLKGNEAFYQQAIQYAESKGKRYAILTNFAEFVILRCDVQPKNQNWETLEVGYIKAIDLNTSIGELEYFKRCYWPEKSSSKISELDSRLNLDKKASIDSRLLENFIRWRQNCLTWLKNNRPDLLTKYDVSFIEEEVQRFLDRIIFVSYSEDKELEDKTLQEYLYNYSNSIKLKGQFFTKSISKLFSIYRERYNSDLFEEGLCDKFDFHDDVIAGILTDIKSPANYLPFDFSLIPSDILGKTYENFIGHLLKPKGKALKEEKSKSKRKSGGIYYTPKHIVDFIVFQTLNDQLKGKSFKDLLKLKILDPACGSGTFLITAFGLLVHHAKIALKKESLDTTELKLIFQNCIFGVDKDDRACDIAKLNFSLLLARKGSKLPRFDSNIVCYDSLIFDKEIAGRKAMIWKNVFKHDFNFIIGNPPYGDYFTKVEKEYVLSKYKETFSGHVDIFIPFFEISRDLLSKNGRLGYIVPHVFLDYSQFKGLRTFLLKYFSIRTLVKTYDVFQDPIVDNAIIVYDRKVRTPSQFKGADLADNSKISSAILEDIDYSCLSADKFILLSSASNLLSRKYPNCTPLNFVVDICQGVTTGGDDIFYMPKSSLKDNGLLGLEFIRKAVVGANVRPFRIDFNNTYLLYLHNKFNIDLKDYPSLQSYLLPHRAKLSKKRETLHGKLPWYCLHWPRDEAIFTQPKLLIRQTASSIIGSFDDKGYFSLDSTHILNLSLYYNIDGYAAEETLLILLAILNSSFMLHYYTQRLNEQGKVYPQVKKSIIEEFPIPQICKTDLMDDLLKESLTLKEKALIVDSGSSNDQEIKSARREAYCFMENIDNLVFDLYNIPSQLRKKLLSVAKVNLMLGESQ